MCAKRLAQNGPDEGLLKRLLKDPGMARAKAHLAEGEASPVNLTGLDDSAKCLAVLGLAEQHPILFISADILRARKAAEDLSAWSGRSCPIFHALPSDLGAVGVQSREGEMERMVMLSDFLHGRLPILVVPAAALADNLPAPEEIRARSIALQRGRSYARETLLTALRDMGYERCRQIETAAQFAVRGDLIDLGLKLSERIEGLDGDVLGIRLSFFDTELEDIRLFDPVDQRSIESREEVLIPPLSEFFISEQEKPAVLEKMRRAAEEARRELLKGGADKEAADRLTELCRGDMEGVEEGIRFAGLKRWEFLLRPQAASILAYGKAVKALLVVDEPMSVRTRADAAEADFRQEAETLMLKAKVPAMSFSNHRDPADIFREIDRYGYTAALAQIASSGNGLPGGLTLPLRTLPAEQYRGRESFLFADLKRWRSEGKEILLCAAGERRRQRLREVLNEVSLTLPLSDYPVNEGFIWPEAELVVIGNRNLFGSEKKLARKKKQNGTPIQFFSDLVPGEWVVHDIHGIGKYLGLKTLVNDGARRDYLHIAYAEDDSLYIPVDRLDEIQKYIAGDGKTPKLSRLGSPEWEKKKARARDSIKKLATDLLAVYAERSQEKGHAFGEDTVWQEEFEESFPYTETEDQLRAMAEIKHDMEQPKVMDRLLCGDVGFGKTELAFRALFKAVMDGRQGALLVPTTVLAQQHYDSFKERLGEFPVRLRLLSRFVSGERRKQTLKELQNGEADVVIGTHRVLSKDVSFARLGLLVVDEEQRFGVDHKESLKARYPLVDVLTLTATPIPRTLHMSMTGIRDISVLEEGPDDRRPVQTYVMEYDAGIIDEAILRELTRGGQVFYLFNDTRKLAGKAAELMERLPGARITYAHGQMSERRLEEAINGFAEGEFDILVCTTIIESGIDMPNVNTIIVENADRMGLAQLYQIRGRVGRSERQAYAYICYKPDKVLNEDARKRLAAIRDFTELGSGFRIALRDLEVRGAGNLLGGEQSGHLEAVGYDLYCRMLEEAIQEARGIEPQERPQECLVDIRLDALIPGTYIEDEGQRMDLYRRALAIRESSDWHDVMDELIDRYGDPPRAVINLLDIALTRAKASAAGIERIETRGKDIYLFLKEGTGAGDKLLELFRKDAFAGRLLFNAGRKAFLVLKGGAEPEESIAETLRNLFI